MRALLRIQSNKQILMYSPKIDQHTPKLYRLARAIDKPMTKVTDDLISFGFKYLKSIYEDLDDERISEIFQEKGESHQK